VNKGKQLEIWSWIDGNWTLFSGFRSNPELRMRSYSEDQWKWQNDLLWEAAVFKIISVRMKPWKIDYTLMTEHGKLTNSKLPTYKSAR